MNVVRFLSYGGLLRRARRHADLSQRELAAKAQVHPSVISRIEAGRQFPAMITMEKLLAATGFVLQAVSADGRHVIDKDGTWADQDQSRDAASRRFPAHLDVFHPRSRRRWWYEFHSCADVKPPLLSFDLSRSKRDLWRELEHRTVCDPDERLRFPFARSEVHIPGYRPESRYGGGSSFW